MEARMAVFVLLSGIFLSSAHGMEVLRGTHETVICAPGAGELEVHGGDLKTQAFSAPNFSPVKVFQGWGENRKLKLMDGREVAYLKVQFPLREEAGLPDLGWVEESLLKPRADCAEAGVAGVEFGSREDNFQGLRDPRCCFFPTKEPTTDYNSGMRRFGAGRAGGRLHAACDLYRHLGEPISSVAPGVVLRDKYFFYQGTYALEVRHGGGFVVRYGEVTGKNAPGIRSGARVSMNQTVAYMGKVNSNCCDPMLHFELFSGAKSGSLSGGGPYQRRSDLLNPTSHLRKWEAATFKHRK